MGQIAKALQRANYLKDLAESIYQYKKSQKLQELNELLKNKYNEFQKDLIQQGLGISSPLSTDIIPQPSTQNIEQLPLELQPQEKGTTQPSQKPPQEEPSGGFDISLKNNNILVKSKKTENELNNLKNMFSDYYRKQSEIMQHAQKLSNFISEALALINSPYLNEQERNYYTSQINAMSNQFTNLLNLLKEQNKIMQYNIGDAQIFSSPTGIATIPETKVDISKIGDATYLGIKELGKSSFTKIADESIAKKEEELNKLTKDILKKQEEAKNKFEGDYTLISNIVGNAMYLPEKNAIGVVNVTNKNGVKTEEVKSLDEIIQTANLAFDPLGTGQKLENINNLMRNIVINARELFNNLGYLDNEGHFYSITGIPLVFKIGNKEIKIDSILDERIPKMIAKSIVEKSKRNNQRISLYNEAENTANRIIDYISSAIPSGDKAFDKHTKSYLTRYYYVKLLTNWKNYLE